MDQAATEAAKEALARSDYWWLWSVNSGVALATLLAALVALFGEKWRARWFKPDLQLRLANPSGELIQSTLIDPTTGQSRTVDARYYHLHVVNKAAWPTATQVQVWLLRVEESGPDSELKTTWASEVPIGWQHQTTRPLAIALPAGGTRADLCSVHRDKGLRLHPIITPNNLEVWRAGPFNIVLTVQARATEGVSQPRRFRVAWDAKWIDGEREMASHFVLSDLGTVEGDPALR